MGYYMSQDITQGSFIIKKSNVRKAFIALKKLALDGKQRGWTRPEPVLAADTFKEAMWEWRWKVISDDQDNVTGIQFEGEKAGDDKDMFDVIAPYVEDGCYIHMHGEEGEQWRWWFKDKKCYEVYPEVIWPENPTDGKDD